MWLAAPIDGIVFGSLHFEGVHTAVILPVIAVFGIGQCLVYERTGSLFAVIAIHAAFNTVATLGEAPVPALIIGASVVTACLVAPRRFPVRAGGDQDMSRRPGALALLLHSHMPYVEGFGTWPFGEEWLWEAVASVYVPLLDVIDGHPVTLGLTPVLCDQFEAMRGEAGDRFRAFLRDIRAPIHEEDARHLEPELAAEVRRAAGDYAVRRAGPRPGGRVRGGSRTWSCGPPPPPTPCCRCSPPTPG